MLKHTVYIGLGSNLGDKKENLRTAIAKIESEIGHVVACSSFYETQPEGFVSDNSFLNGVCCVETNKTPIEVLDVSQEIEKQLGRKSKSVNEQYADRIIDIDILLYDDLTISDQRLMLPHPYLHQRGFVILPFAQIASEVVHPTLGKTIGQLRDEFLSGEYS